MTYRGHHRSRMSRRGFLIGGGMAAAGVVAGGAVWRARSRPAGGRSADGSERSTVHAREPSGQGGVVEIAHAREDRFATQPAFQVAGKLQG